MASDLRNGEWAARDSNPAAGSKVRPEPDSVTWENAL